MQTLTVEVVARGVNCSVVKMPERKHPALVIQGDSFHNVYVLVQELQQSIRTGSPAVDLADEITDLLGGYHKFFEESLTKGGLELPY